MTFIENMAVAANAWQAANMLTTSVTLRQQCALAAYVRLHLTDAHGSGRKLWRSLLRA